MSVMFEKVPEPTGMRIRYDLPKKEMRLQYASFSPPPSVELHLHNDYEIFFLLEGEINYHVNGNLYSVKPYDIMITNPREVHTPIFLSPKRYRRITLTFQPSFIAQYLSHDFNPLSLFEDRSLGTQNRISAQNVRALGLDKLIKEIIVALKKNDEGILTFSKISLMLLLFKLSKTLSLKNANKELDSRIAEIFNYIEKNIAGDLSYDAISREVYISRNYLGDFFQRNTGFSLGSYITKQRISYAKELLMRGTPSTLLPEKCGFSDYSNFYRSFKKETGYSPKAFVATLSSMQEAVSETQTNIPRF